MRNKAIVFAMAMVMVFALPFVAAEGEGHDNPYCDDSVHDLPAHCSGTIVSDTVEGWCWTIVCEEGNVSKTVKACDKDGYYDVYNQDIGDADHIAAGVGEVILTDWGYGNAPYPECPDTQCNEDLLVCQETLSQTEADLLACEAEVDALTQLVQDIWDLINNSGVLP